MTIRKFLRYYISFIIFSIVIGILIGLLITSDTVILSKPERGWDFTLEVLKNNSNNFLSYIFLFFLSPALQLIDLVSVVIQITLGMRKSGFLITALGLFPHGLLEIPNFLFYQGLSQYMLWTVLTEKSVISFLERERRYVRYYVVSYCVLLIAGIIEGLLG